MLSRDFEDEIWSRYVFELVIWPQEVTLVRRTQPSGPLCLWQCLCYWCVAGKSDFVLIPIWFARPGCGGGGRVLTKPTLLRFPQRRHHHVAEVSKLEIWPEMIQKFFMGYIDSLGGWPKPRRFGSILVDETRPSHLHLILKFFGENMTYNGGKGKKGSM